MKNGGVAILGKAEVEGENRAQRAIEEALNSPLLNDNDIKGAKWILLNINSAEGDFECSMDELETISTILRERTGENSDVIMGSGYDDTLGEKIGITLIATGFEGKDPFKNEDLKKAEAPVEDKIVMTLSSEQEVANTPVENPSSASVVDTYQSNTAALESIEEPIQILNEEIQEAFQEEVVVSESIAESFELDLTPTIHYEDTSSVTNVFVSIPDEEIENEIEESIDEVEFDGIEENTDEVFELNMEVAEVEDFTSAFVLSKPTNIYAEAENTPVVDVVEENTQEEIVAPVQEASPIVEATETVEHTETSFRFAVEEEPTMQLVMREEEFTPSNVETRSAQNYDMPLDDSEEQRRKVRERIQKLRNLSFNIGNGNDPSAEFDEVPAYVRRNMDLFGNTLASVENFYSKYTVEQDDQNQSQLSTLNTFLDGKKPD
jgi:cell division protein FtsZ